MLRGVLAPRVCAPPDGNHDDGAQVADFLCADPAEQVGLRVRLRKPPRDCRRSIGEEDRKAPPPIIPRKGKKNNNVHACVAVRSISELLAGSAGRQRRSRKPGGDEALLLD